MLVVFKSVVRAIIQIMAPVINAIPIAKPALAVEMIVFRALLIVNKSIWIDQNQRRVGARLIAQNSGTQLNY